VDCIGELTAIRFGRFVVLFHLLHDADHTSDAGKIPEDTSPRRLDQQTEILLAEIVAIQRLHIPLLRRCV